MADIELVIKISGELYRAYKDRPPMLGDVGMDMIAQAIANGKPLPKGHGRLIDADAITKDLNTFQDAFAINMTNGRIIGIACSAPTIIEADKESEDT